ncbi:GPP34 family phosphoprotein [Kutzneria sp. 744]|uniref:GOLPH3/VPS74 family protein n=1 Tax=Kutzneria sp. (strain 744) TaxID=345341 RepID=UPI000694D266|nr:GPP34 family phosphoprotein [Kutzneria sp. 744]
MEDSFYLLAHWEDTGRPRLSRPALGVGLAGAMLGELLVHKHIRIEDHAGVLVPAVRDPRPPACPLAHEVLDQLQHATGQSIRDWLDFLALDACSRVEKRLVRADVVREVETGLLRRHRVYQPFDPNESYLVTIRVSGLANRWEQPAPSDALLLGLAAETALHRVLIQDVRHRDAYLGWVRANLPPAMTCLIDEVRALIGAVALNRAR